MRRRFICRSAALLAGALAVPLAMAVGAARSASVSCDAASGSTLIANESARVFTADGRDYACARPGGPIHPLYDTNSAVSSSSVKEPTLAGRFVAWKRVSEAESLGRSERALVLLDLGSGISRVVVAAIGQSQAHPSFSLGDFVLNQHGTLVWLVNSSSCSNNCDTTSRLSESRVGHPNSVLAKATSTGPANGPHPHAPIGSLGLSRSGHVAYWMTNGDLHSHHIP